MKTIQWYNENSHRRYPFIDDCPTDIPNDLFLDFQFVSYVLPAGHIRLLKIVVAVTEANFIFEYTNLADTNIVQFEAPVTNIGLLSIPYHVTLWQNDTRLQIWLGNAVNTWLPTASPPIHEMPKGMYLQPALSTFQDKHRVDSLIGDTEDSVAISGDIYVQDGYNMDANVNVDAQAIQFFAMPGVGRGRSTTRLDPDRPGCEDVLMNINGVYADRSGAFRLKGSNGVVITPVPEAHELQIQVAMNTNRLKCLKKQKQHQPGE